METTQTKPPAIDWFEFQDGRAIRDGRDERFASRKGDPSFDALLTALALKADPANLARLESAFPEKVATIRARHNAMGGLLPGDPDEAQDYAAGRRHL